MYPERIEMHLNPHAEMPAERRRELVIRALQRAMRDEDEDRGALGKE